MKVSVEIAAGTKPTLKQLQSELNKVQDDLESRLNSVKGDSNPQAVQVKNKLDAQLQVIESVKEFIKRGSTAGLRNL